MKFNEAGLGDTLAEMKKRYGRVVEVSRYRPDLYPTSYVFLGAGAKIQVTVLPEVVSHLDIFFSRRVSDSAETLLECFSGCGGWQSRPLTDPEFAREFSVFSTTAPNNRFFATDGAFALVQHDVGDFKVVLMVQTDDYLMHLREYRRAQKPNQPPEPTR